jgi:DNA-binding transcriptional regulator LsrR (DeoR family)
MAKLTETSVLECRRRYAAGETQRALAAEFGIAQAAMSQVITGARWAWLPGAVPIDKKRHGRGGSAHHAAKLTPELVEQARTRCANGEKQGEVAASMGVTRATLWKAINGLTWTGGKQQ